MREALDINVTDTPARTIDRAKLLLGLRTVDAVIAIAVDTDTGTAVRLPGLPTDPRIRLLHLGPAGDRLLVLAARDGQRYGGLCLHALATGEQRWYPAQADGQDWLAALSPDGKTIATLATTEEDLDQGSVVLNVVDVVGGQRRRLVTVPGGFAAECAIAWSPNGQLIAATYLTEDEDDATLILDSDGTVIGRYDDARILPGGAWATDRELLCQNGLCELSIVDVADGTSRLLMDGTPPPLGYAGGRLVGTLPVETNGPVRLVTFDLDRGDQRPFVTVRPAYSIELFGTAAG
jgi:hypothetical protein